MILLLPVLSDKCYIAIHDKILLYHILDSVRKYKNELTSVVFVCNKDIEKVEDYVCSYFSDDFFMKNKCKFVYTNNDSIVNALYMGLHNNDVVEPVLLWSSDELCINSEVIFSTKNSYRGIYKDLYVDIYMFKNFNALKNIYSVMPKDMNEVCEIYSSVDPLKEEENIDYVPLSTNKEIVEAINYFIENDENNIFSIKVDEDSNYIEKKLKVTTKENMRILYLEKEFYKNTDYDFCPKILDYYVGWKPEQVTSLTLKKVSGIPLSTLLYTDYDCSDLGNKIYSRMDKLHNKNSRESVPYNIREKYIRDKKLDMDYIIKNSNLEDKEKYLNLNDLYYNKYKTELENLVIYNIDNHVFNNLKLENILVDIYNSDMYFINPRTELNHIGFILDDYVDLFYDLDNMPDIVDVDIIRDAIYKRINFNKEIISLAVEMRKVIDNACYRRDKACCCI